MGCSLRQIIWRVERDFQVSGDFDGDGRRDEGTYCAGAWRLRLSGHKDDDGTADGSQHPTETVRHFGESDSDHTPIVGDWNGDGRDDLGLYHPATGRWLFDVDEPNEKERIFIDAWPPGTPAPPASIPLVGRWEGGTRDQIGLASFRDGGWNFQLTTEGGRICIRLAQGDQWSIPVAGRFDDSHRDVVGLMDHALHLEDGGEIVDGHGAMWIDVALTGGSVEFVVDPGDSSSPRRLPPVQQARIRLCLGTGPIALRFESLGRGTRSGMFLSECDIHCRIPRAGIVAFVRGYDGGVHLLDMRTGAKRGMLRVNKGYVSYLTVSPRRHPGGQLDQRRNLAVGSKYPARTWTFSGTRP